MVNYANLFEDLGVFVAAVDQLQDIATGNNSPRPNLSALQAAIHTTLNDNGSDGLLEGVNALFTQVADRASASAESIAEKCDERLQDRETIQNELLSTQDATLDEILHELVRAMGNDSASVKQSVVTAGTPSADSGNVGDGTLYVTKILDGAAAPLTRGLPLLQYKGLDSELVVPSETVVLTCNADADRNQVPEGHERFLLEGQSAPDSTFGWRSEGSGEARDIVTDNAWEVIANRNWEVWNTDGTLVSWTPTGGVAGTNYLPDYDSANVFRGSASLQLNGTAQMNQAIFKNLLIPNRLYRLTCAWKSDATTGTVRLELVSDKEPTAFANQLDIPVASQATFVLATQLIMMPANFTDDIQFRITATGLDAELWLDSISFAPVNYAGGMGYNIVSGAEPFSVEDRFRVTNTSTEGIFQRFFRRKYATQLPSNPTPSIADSLAQA